MRITAPCSRGSKYSAIIAKIGGIPIVYGTHITVAHIMIIYDEVVRTLTPERRARGLNKSLVRLVRKKCPSLSEDQIEVALLYACTHPQEIIAGFSRGLIYG